MITNKFNSTKNKNAIRSIINDDITKKFNKNINNNYDNMISDTMEYVLSQVSPNTPKGMKDEDYLYLMNKKVYDIVTPLIASQIKKPIINPLRVTEASFTNKNNNNIVSKWREKQDRNNREEKELLRNDYNSNLQDKIFDPILLKNFETPKTLMDYPIPAANKSPNKKINDNPNIIKPTDLKDVRIAEDNNPLFTMQKESQMQIDNTQLDTTQLYNQLLSNYNTQINNMSNFENNQKNMNKNIEDLENNTINKFIDEDKSFTPINLLKDPKLTNEFFDIKDKNQLNNSIGNNIAYNRNDIETFINNNIEDYSPPLIDKTLIPTNYKNNGIMYNTYNGNNLEFGPSNIQNNPIMLDEPKFKIINKNFFIVIDSADRDLYEFPNPSTFQIKFAPAGNSLRIEAFYDKYNTLILNEKLIIFGDSSNTSIRETMDNIKTIYCSSVNFPTNIIYYGSTEPQSTDSGVGISIFNQSYLYLIIKELMSPYTGSNTIAQNAFCKLLIDYSSNINSIGTLALNQFTILTCSNPNEIFTYDPVTLGKLDKFTINLVNKNGIPYNIGIDKLFVNSFNLGSTKYNGYCGNAFITTIINIQNLNSEYAKYCSLYTKTGNCNLINSHPIKNGDLIYFYNTRPNLDQIAYFEDYIKISKLKYDKVNNKLNIYLQYLKNINNNEEKINVNLKDVLGSNILIYKDYYIVFFDTKKSYHYFLKIDEIYDNYIVVEYKESLPIFKNYNIIKVGITKSFLRGSNDDNPRSLFYKGGYTVLNVGNTIDTQWDIEINFPYYNLPEYILNSTVYYPGEIFLIQEKLQVSYNFQIVVEIKDYDKLKSGLNESGNN